MKNMREMSFVLSVAALAIVCQGMAAVPSLKGSAEPAGAMGLKVRPLASAQAVPAPTPEAKRYGWKRGSESGEVTHHDVREIWLLHERGCQWKDRKGNKLTLATVSSLCPEFEYDHEERAKIEAAIKEGTAAFKEPTNEQLAKWVSQFTGKQIASDAISSFAASRVLEAKLVDFGGGARCAAFFKSKDGAWRYAEFLFAQEAKERDAQRLMKQFLSGVVVDKTKSAAAGGITTEGKWTTMKVPGYIFKTDLPPSQRGAFLKDTSRYMVAMQAAYRRYVPPQRELGDSTIRVFADKADYDAYAKDTTGEDNTRSIGLWNPSREELLILNQGKDVAERRETMKIMRHEAFHQYLFYATGNGNHAMWFNEGHACFFENVMYSPKKNTVRFYEDLKDRRAGAVAEDPEKYANLVPKILYMNRAAFYGGTLQAVNDKYTAAWAATYFLEKGAPSFEEFAAYRNVLPTYLKETAAGKSWEEATKIAWEGLEAGFPAAFMKFWNKRAGARNYEPPEPKAK